MFFKVGKKNVSFDYLLKGSLRNPKYGITLESPFGTFIFKSVGLIIIMRCGNQMSVSIDVILNFTWMKTMRDRLTVFTMACTV